MKLETEFRVYVQLQRLMGELFLTPTPFSHVGEASSVATEAGVATAHEFTANVWVELCCAPDCFSSDQALLLCPCSENHWVAWVPDFGEIELAIDEFRPLMD